MDLNVAFDLVLNWANYGKSVDKIGFVKAFVNCLSLEELAHIKNILTKTASKSYNKALQWTGPKFTPISKSVVVSTLDQLNSSPTAAVVSTLPMVMSTPTPAVGPMMSCSMSTPATYWFMGYKKPNIYCVDIEKVTLEVPSNSCFGSIKAASVSVVDYFGNTIYDKLIYHQPDSFKVNKYTRMINGFHRNSLVNGINYNVVQSELRALFKDKLLILVAAEGDFRSLELSSSEFIFFDLQSAYYRTKVISSCYCMTEECYCDKKEEPMSLRDMYFYHFKKDIQKGTHNSLDDAISTLEVFRYGYVPTQLKENNFSRYFDSATYNLLNSAPNLKVNEKNGFIYDEDSSSFVKKKV